jgi:hypothetical protein
VDGKEGNLYDRIGAGSLTFSPDGSRLAYVAKRDSKWLTVLDGLEFPPSVSPIVFSPDSSHFAFTEEAGHKYRLILDGVTAREYDYVDSIGFLDQSSTLDKRWKPAYIARRGAKFFLVRGTEEGKEYQQIGSLVIPPGSDETYKKTGIKNLVFSPDHKHVGFDACPIYNGPWNVVVDGVEFRSYTDLAEGRLTFAADTGEVAYQAWRDDRKWAVLRNNSECGAYDGVEYLGFSPKGNHLVWTAKIGDGREVFFDKVNNLPASWEASSGHPSKYERGHFHPASKLTGI